MPRQIIGSLAVTTNDDGIIRKVERIVLPSTEMRYAAFNLGGNLSGLDCEFVCKHNDKDSLLNNYESDWLFRWIMLGIFDFQMQEFRAYYTTGGIVDEMKIKEYKFRNNHDFSKIMKALTFVHVAVIFQREDGPIIL